MFFAYNGKYGKACDLNRGYLIEKGFVYNKDSNEWENKKLDIQVSVEVVGYASFERFSTELDHMIDRSLKRVV
jgi:hypothetical protein